MAAAMTVNDACGHRLNLLADQSTRPVSARSTSPSETDITRVGRSLPIGRVMYRRTLAVETPCRGSRGR
eukprot:5447101-Alexandrium_andersonii.AAC.1